DAEIEGRAADPTARQAEGGATIACEAVHLVPKLPQSLRFAIRLGLRYDFFGRQFILAFALVKLVKFSLKDVSQRVEFSWTTRGVGIDCLFLRTLRHCTPPAELSLRENRPIGNERAQGLVAARRPGGGSPCAMLMMAAASLQHDQAPPTPPASVPRSASAKSGRGVR